MRRRKRRLLQKFFADRGPHLAAMIAYFALLSFVPLTFLALSLLGLAGRPDESSFVVEQIRKAFPATPIPRIVELVDTVRANATTLGIVGAAFLLWTALSLFSVLESAFNIVYERPNRGFLHGKALAVALMLGSLATLFVALLIGSLGYELLQRYASGVVDNAAIAYALSLVISTVGVFAFLVSVYYVLTNARVTLREVLPGALLATVILQASFQVLPLYVRFANVNVALKTFGGPAILLVWLYVMSNVIVFGAELNWWRTRAAAERTEDTAAGLA